MPQYYSVSGFDELDKALSELDKKVSKKLLKDGMKAGMKPMLAAARAAAPVDTGNLKRHIKLRASKKSRTSFGSTIGVGEKDFQGKAWYGAAQEFGTSKMPPKGFLRQAYDANKANAVQIAADTIKSGLAV